MTLFSLIIALLIEQVRPLPVDRLVLAPLRALSRSLLQRFNDGQARHGRLAWGLVVLLGSVLTALAHYLLWELHPVFAFAFNVAVLYLTMGFRQESHFFSDIHLALRMGEIDRARTLLGEWRGGQYGEASSSEVARLAIEQALVAAHRNVFGVAFWFVILPGPSGAVMYRLARFFADDWRRGPEADLGDFGRFAQRAFELIDWLPARLTAASFSVAGDFEDAIYCWRTQAVLWPDKSSAILIASGGGALGVRLGMPVHESGGIIDRPEMGQGDEADADHMQSTVGLVWRALLVCLFLLALVGLAGWVSG
ncbi:CobD/CbiB family protein [Thauera linaloolentis]|uniref:Cobalamin biosynthesis protein CobD n=1 Tax=Thauera linaloolentis (strain DSM 12138 / JCM 21573 / CCUG 41526 / CIP 105981 / IAM 15112 / NBRC 102519 / 47Lol) TaxID=1123367 RepID=N6Z5A8_THAL4|nr:CobD/CbiB family protein [Thauera linaloolentis]ENO89608.1 CobD/CbiB family protein [Thauera linaloolentis 47Lol = DSM 12138]MCM8565926.1 CobD/CbiB family protein [Thauera linaloolentis]